MNVTCKSQDPIGARISSHSRNGSGLRALSLETSVRQILVVVAAAGVQLDILQNLVANTRWVLGTAPAPTHVVTDWSCAPSKRNPHPVGSGGESGRLRRVLGTPPQFEAPALTHGCDCFTETFPRGTLIHIGYGIAGNSESQDSDGLRGSRR